MRAYYLHGKEKSQVEFELLSVNGEMVNGEFVKELSAFGFQPSLQLTADS